MYLKRDLKKHSVLVSDLFSFNCLMWAELVWVDLWCSLQNSTLFLAGHILQNNLEMGRHPYLLKWFLAPISYNGISTNKLLHFVERYQNPRWHYPNLGAFGPCSHTHYSSFPQWSTILKLYEKAGTYLLDNNMILIFEGWQCTSIMHLVDREKAPSKWYK